MIWSIYIHSIFRLLTITLIRSCAIQQNGGYDIMELMYQSTRSDGAKVTASQAILRGLASDGGLCAREYTNT